jgi:hypothetical protein
MDAGGINIRFTGGTWPASNKEINISGVYLTAPSS